jgi:hypothetical protein
VPPKGVDWSSFSVQVAESEIENLESILEQYESTAVEMGVAAQRAWRDQFSGAAALKRIIRECQQLGALKKLQPAPLEIESYYISRVHLRRAISSALGPGLRRFR